MSSKWRSRLTGAHDEFSERGTELTNEQREHLTRVTDELLKRYSISRSPSADGSGDEAAGEPVSATEIGAVLESVLVEAFDFGWFTRADLPEAPELALESMELEQEHSPAPGTDAGLVVESLTWPDPTGEADQAAGAAADWGRGLGPARAVEPVPESELELELEPEPEPEPEPELELEPEPEPEPESEPVPDSELELEPEPGVLTDAEIEIAELEEIHRAAVEAERAAIRFAAATRQRLAQARERWERNRS